jgi:hypothetical protein
MMRTGRLYHVRFTVLLGLAASGFVGSAAWGQEQAEGTSGKPASVVEPRQVIPLVVKGEGLSERWTTWLEDAGREDPRGVFQMQPDGVLRISGDGIGGLLTRREYANYHLIVEYRWGTATWRGREGKARDSGLLLHAQGPEGNFGGSGGKPGPWMTSIECQIIEGGAGDLLVLSGHDAEGKPMPAGVTATVRRDRDGEPVWTPDGGTSERFTDGRVNWQHRDPDWKDESSFRGRDDVESPGQEWTTLECFCQGDTLTYRVNGVVVNRATDVVPSQGKILLQTEGAELFVRRLELRPLSATRP